MINHLCEESKICTNRKKNCTFHVTSDEFRAYNCAVSGLRTRSRFQEIVRYSYLAEKGCIGSKWVNTNLGYLIQCYPYSCKGYHNAKFDLGGSVIARLVSKLPSEFSFNVTFDNLFTSLALLNNLSENGIGGTDTLTHCSQCTLSLPPGFLMFSGVETECIMNK